MGRGWRAAGVHLKRLGLMKSPGTPTQPTVFPDYFGLLDCVEAEQRSVQKPGYPKLHVGVSATMCSNPFRASPNFKPSSFGLAAQSLSATGWR
jgi:hypothetical protein